MPKAWFLSWTYWQKRPALLISFVLLIAFVVALVSAVLTFSFKLSLVSETLESSDLRITALSRDGTMPLDAQLRSAKGLVQTTPFLFRESYLRTSAGQAISVFGIDPTRYQEKRYFTSGRALDKYDSRSVIVSSSLARQLELQRFDTVWLATPEGFQDYIITGVVIDTNARVIMPLTEMQAAFTSGLPLVSWYDLKVSRNARISSLVAELKASIPSSMLIQTNPKAASGGLLQLKLFLRLFVLLSLIASAYLLLNNLTLLKLERYSEFKLLHALGLSKATLAKLVFKELFVIASFAALLGGFAAVFLYKALYILFQEHIFSFVPLSGNGVVSFELPLVVISVTALILVVISQQVFGAKLLSPAHEPAQPKVNEAQDTRAGWSKLADILPNSVWLSQRLVSVFQKRDRYAFMFLVLSLSIVVALFSMANSYEGSASQWSQTLDKWDLVVVQKDQISGVSIPFAESVQKKIEALPGVLAVASDYKTNIQQGNLKANLFISNAYDRPLKSIQGIATEALPNALKGARNIAIAESLATLYNLDAGTELMLMTPTGEQSYNIVAIIDDRGAEPRGIFIDREQYSQDWQQSSADLFTVSITDKASAERVARLIEKELSADYLVNVSSITDAKAASEAVIGKTFGFGQGLASMFVLMALAVLVNLSTERLPSLSKDLKLLKALGASSLLLRKVLLSNLVFSVCLSATLALWFGTLLSYLSVNLLKYSGRFTLAWYWPSDVYSSVAVASLGILVITVLFADQTLKRELNR